MVDIPLNKEAKLKQTKQLDFIPKENKTIESAKTKQNKNKQKYMN